jgi:hypothetical protein
MMQRVTSRQRPVRQMRTAPDCNVVNTITDDIRDIYRRAEGHELVVEGLRDGQNLVAEE